MKEVGDFPWWKACCLITPADRLKMFWMKGKKATDMAVLSRQSYLLLG
jgi:hypothetical protein